MKKIGFLLLFFTLTVFACEKEELCNSSTGTLIIENNLGPSPDLGAFPELLTAEVHIYMWNKLNQKWHYHESKYIAGEYYVFQLKKGEYRIETLWSSRKDGGEVELFIIACEEITLPIPSLILTR